MKASRANELLALPLEERLARRIIDGERKGLEDDLQACLDKGTGAARHHQRLPARRHEDRGRAVRPGRDAAAVRAAVGRGDEGGRRLPRAASSRSSSTAASARPRRGIVLATVKGDVHDIGKNLVDIILSNNGYEVVNLGIKQPISEIIRAADEHDADAIGMSGLLVKSTVVMKENLEELNSRGARGALARAARRCGPDPRLRRERPGRGLRGRGPLRPGRLRGSAPHGRRGPGQGEPGPQRRRGAARAAQAPGPPGRPGPTTTPRCGHDALRRRHRQLASRHRRSGAPGWSRASPWPTTRPTSTSARPSWASGA